MLRSLFAGVSGLRSHQTMMDVLGSNIANVNTVGYRTGRMTFQDLLSQTLSGAQSSSDTRGGVNPKQIGLGAQIGAVDTIFTQGNFQTTERLLDLAIQGSGFFQLVDAQDNSYFTRAGNFGMDHEGYLVNPSNGLRLHGLMADSDGNIDENQTARALQIDFSKQSDAIVTRKATFGGNLDSRTEPEMATLQSQLIGLYDDLGRSLNLRIGDVIEFSTGTVGGSALANEEVLTVDSNTTLSDLADAIKAKLQDVSGSSLLSVSVSSEGGIRVSTDAGNAIEGITMGVQGGSNEVLKYIFQERSAGNFDNDFDVAASSFTDTRSFRQADVSNSIKVYDSQGNPRTLTTTFAKDTARLAATSSTLLRDIYNLKGDSVYNSSHHSVSGTKLLTDLTNADGTSVGLSAGEVISFTGGTITDGTNTVNLAGLSFQVEADSTLSDLLAAIESAVEALDIAGDSTEIANFTSSINADGTLTLGSTHAIADMEIEGNGGSSTLGALFEEFGEATSGDGMDIAVSGTVKTEYFIPHYVQFTGGTIDGTNVSALTTQLRFDMTETATIQDLLNAMETSLESSGADVTLALNADGTISISSDSEIANLQISIAGQSSDTAIQSLFEEQGSIGALDGINVAADGTTTTESFRGSVLQRNTWNWRAIVPHTTELFPSSDSGTIVFNSAGKFVNYGSEAATSNPTLEFDPDGLSGPSGGVDELSIVMDMKGLTQYATASTASIRAQDGQGVGTLDNINIDPEGTITGVFTNGATVNLARIQLAYFSNEGGLRRVGDSMFQESGNSGSPILGTAGEDGRGTISSGTLELSNVDLAQQFTDLIVAQRGFQANSRVITTSDEVLTEVVNLKR